MPVLCTSARKSQYTALLYYQVVTAVPGTRYQYQSDLTPRWCVAAYSAIDIAARDAFLLTSRSCQRRTHSSFRAWQPRVRVYYNGSLRDVHVPGTSPIARFGRGCVATLLRLVVASRTGFPSASFWSPFRILASFAAQYAFLYTSRSCQSRILPTSLSRVAILHAFCWCLSYVAISQS